MSQETNAGAPTSLETAKRGAPPANAGPDVLYPRCPWCGADPVILYRLRYDFPDGVVAETLFCGGKKADGTLCRMIIDARIIGFERPAGKPVPPPAG
jgi:hypothetical protein